MLLFILGLIIFFGAHFFTAFARVARADVITRLGPMRYRGLFSLVAFIGLALIIVGWPDADKTVLYVTPPALRHVTYGLVLIAFVLLAAAYLPAGKIAAAAKHPMLASVKIWAFAHLLVNGDVRSLLLFGSFLGFSVIDRIVLKRRGAPTPTAGPIKNDLIAVAVGVIAYGAVAFYLHQYIAGVALF